MTVRSALRPGRPSSPRIFLVLISVRGWVDPRVIVRLEGLGQMKKSNDLIGIRTCSLPACSIVHQPTTLSRAPRGYIKITKTLVLCSVTPCGFVTGTIHSSHNSTFLWKQHRNMARKILFPHFSPMAINQYAPYGSRFVSIIVHFFPCARTGLPSSPLLRRSHGHHPCNYFPM
jgi:hypothetical protein